MKTDTKQLYTLSQDYEKLFQLIVAGHRVAAWSDTFSMQDEHGQPYRDVCEVRRTGEYQIQISARGTGYGSVWPFMEEEGSEEAVFFKICQGCNLSWIDPDPDTK